MEKMEIFGTNSEVILREECSSELLVNFIHRFAPKNAANKLDRISSGIDYLNKKCSAVVGFQCKMGCDRGLNPSTNIPVEIFSSGLIHDLLKDIPQTRDGTLDAITSFIKETVQEERRTFNFFQDRTIMPDEVDTTTVSLWALIQSGLTSQQDAIISMTNVLENKSPSGIIETFFPPFTNKRGQLDCCVLSNVLRVVYFLNLQDGVEKTEEFLLEMLEGKEEVSFENGLFYYDSPDSFPYFLSNCVEISERAEKLFKSGLVSAVKKRLETGSLKEKPIDVAMRISTIIKLGIQDDVKVELEREVTFLSSLQKEDGSWPKDSIYRYKKWFFGSRSLSTAFAVRALSDYDKLL